MATKIQIRRGLSTEWASANPTLAAGELAVETDTKQLKIGDGATAYNSLAYVATGSMDVASSNLDDLDDGTTYKRIAAAVATALNAGTYDAATVSAFGIGSACKNLGAGIDFDDLITNGFFFLTTGVVNPPYATDYWFVIVASENVAAQAGGVQLAWKAGAAVGNMYMRESYYDATNYVWSPWRTIWTSGNDGNGGQPPAPKPNLTSGAIGELVNLYPGEDAPLVAPSGGVWVVRYHLHHNASRTAGASNSYDAITKVSGGGTVAGAPGLGVQWIGEAYRSE